jgi:AraC family transcriptional regulator
MSVEDLTKSWPDKRKSLIGEVASAMTQTMATLPNAEAIEDFLDQVVSLVELARHHESKHDLRRKGGLATWQVDSIETFVACKTPRTITVCDLRLVTKLSRGHFSRAFLASFGKSPRAYLQATKYRYAKQLLIDTGLSLSEIAREAGFSDQAHLCRVFRQMEGIPPGVWRRQRKLNDQLTHAR